MTRTALSPLNEMQREKIGNGLSYGDSKREWIRHSIKIRQHVDPILDEVYESCQGEERLELVKKAVREKVDELKRESGK